MKQRLLIAAIAFVVINSSWLNPIQTQAQSDDPTSTIQAFIQAFNAYDTTAATNLVTDDFELSIIYGTPDDPRFTGKDGLSELIAAVKADQFQLSFADLKADGGSVTGTYSGEGNDIRGVGVGPEIGTITAVVENGLLDAITFTVDPEFNARYDAAVAAQEQLPQTGAGASTPPVALVAFGLGILMFGALVYIRSKGHVQDRDKLPMH